MCPWSTYAPATISFCERRLCAWVVEPSNTWSNVAYVLAGLWILSQCRPWRDDARTAIGVVAVLLGLGSFAFHATGVRVFEVVDVSGMYLVSGLGLTFALARWLGWSPRRAMAFLVAIAVGSSLLMIALGNDGIVVFGVEMLAVFAIEIHLRTANPPGAGIWLLRAVAMLLVGLVIWTLDLRGSLCDPDNHLVTGHAVWHVLTALAVLLFDRFQQAVGGGAPAMGRRTFASIPRGGR